MIEKKKHKQKTCARGGLKNTGKKAPNKTKTSHTPKKTHQNQNKPTKN